MKKIAADRNYNIMKKSGAKVFVLNTMIGNSSNENITGIYSSYEKAIEAKKEDEDRSSRDGVKVLYAIDQWILDSGEVYRLLWDEAGTSITPEQFEQWGIRK